jgi:hypothetical protein
MKSRKNQNYKNNKMAGITIFHTIITLNVDGLNFPIKRQIRRSVLKTRLLPTRHATHWQRQRQFERERI